MSIFYIAQLARNASLPKNIFIIISAWFEKSAYVLWGHHGIFEILTLICGINSDESLSRFQLLRGAFNLHFDCIYQSMKIPISLFHLVPGVAPFDGAGSYCDAEVLGSEPKHAKSVSLSRLDTPRASKKAGMREVAS